MALARLRDIGKVLFKGRMRETRTRFKYRMDEFRSVHEMQFTSQHL